MKQLLAVTALLLSYVFASAAAPEVIPTLKEWEDSPNGGVFTLQPESRVLVSPVASDQLRRMAGIFAAELNRRADTISGISTGGLGFAPAAKDDIELRVNPKLSRDPEDYRIEVTPNGILLTGTTHRAVFWGTRTLLQVFRSQNNTFPCGIAVDGPVYPSRGFVFDCGSKPFTLTTLRAIVDICAYYKMNELQLHLSDNFIWLDRYPCESVEELLAYEPSPGAFRLESQVPGLTARDIFYTKKDLRELIAYADDRGVTLIPEIDVPGHAFALVRARPDLMYRDASGKKGRNECAAMLDLSRPETFDFVTALFDEYIDSGIFSGPVVHVGADEYCGDNESYRAFTDRLLRYIIAKGKTPRFWGSLTYKRGKTPVTSDGVEMNIWSMNWQDPCDAVEAGYRIVNTLDVNLYAVPNGTSDIGPYGDDLDSKKLYETWAPHVFTRGRKVRTRDARLLGGAWALWCDNAFMGDPGLIGRDLLETIRRNCAVVGLKCWDDLKPVLPYGTFLQTIERNGSPVCLKAPQWRRSYAVTRRGPGAIRLAEGDETDLYAVSPIDGRVGYRSEGAFYSFDYEIPQGASVALTFDAVPRGIRLLVDGRLVGGIPRRRYFPDTCRYYSVAEPERDRLVVDSRPLPSPPDTLGIEVVHMTYYNVRDPQNISATLLEGSVAASGRRPADLINLTDGENFGTPKPMIQGLRRLDTVRYTVPINRLTSPLSLTFDHVRLRSGVTYTLLLGDPWWASRPIIDGGNPGFMRWYEFTATPQMVRAATEGTLRFRLKEQSLRAPAQSSPMRLGDGVRPMP